MRGNLRLSIGNGEKRLCLDYDLLVEDVSGGVRVIDRESGESAVLWDEELRAVARIGGGPTPMTAVLVSELINQKFLPAN